MTRSMAYDERGKREHLCYGEEASGARHVAAAYGGGGGKHGKWQRMTATTPIGIGGLKPLPPSAT